MDPRDNQEQVEDNSENSTSLISELGKDLSISCLLHCSRSDFGSIASLNNSFRSLVKSGFLYKLRKELGMVEHWIYFTFKVFEGKAFDPVRCKWMTLPPIPTDTCFILSHKESLAVGTQLLVFGSKLDSHATYKYSLLTHAWTSGIETNVPRFLFASASLGDIAIVAGGCNSIGSLLSSAELYNSETGTWRTLPSMITPRKRCSGVFMDGKFYVLGGVTVATESDHYHLELITSGEVFDLESNSWMEIPNMLPNSIRAVTSRTTIGPPLVAVVKNELYGANHLEKQVWKYNKEKNVWTMIGRLPEHTTSVNGWGLAFRACGDQLIFAGERDGNGRVIEIYAWEPSDHEGPLQWTLLDRKINSGSYVYTCAVMGC